MTTISNYNICTKYLAAYSTIELLAANFKHQSLRNVTELAAVYAANSVNTAPLGPDCCQIYYAEPLLRHLNALVAAGAGFSYSDAAAQGVEFLKLRVTDERLCEHKERLTALSAYEYDPDKLIAAYTKDGELALLLTNSAGGKYWYNTVTGKQESSTYCTWAGRGRAHVQRALDAAVKMGYTNIHTIS